MVIERQHPELSKVADEISRCGRCGFCQNVCPVYQATAHEEGVARGRNMYAKALLEGALEILRENEAFFTECLLCRACVETCFSSVKTDDIVLAMRRDSARVRRRSALHRYIFDYLLPDHKRLERALRFASLGKTAGAIRLAQALDVFGWYGGRFQRFDQALSGLPQQSLRRQLAQQVERWGQSPAFGGTKGSRRNSWDSVSVSRLNLHALDDGDSPESTRQNTAAVILGTVPFATAGQAHSPLRDSDIESTPTKKNAYFFIGCGINFMFPQVGEATVEVLQKLGYDVTITDNACCGLPAYAHGSLNAAFKLAEKNIKLFSQPDALIITDCSSCASFLKEYPALISTSGGSEVLAQQANEFSARVRDVAEVLAEGAPVLSRMKSPSTEMQRITFHDPCHLSRHQKLSSVARGALRSLENVEFVEMKEADMCCGGAGAFAFEHPELSLKVLERKMKNIETSGADIVATTCPSCMMQLRNGLMHSGGEADRQLRVVHLVELVR